MNHGPQAVMNEIRGAAAVNEICSRSAAETTRILAAP